MAGRSPEPPVEGSWTVSGQDAGDDVGASRRSEPTATAARSRSTGTVDVSAPLVAGKIEDLISREITKLIGAQQDFAAAVAGRAQRLPDGRPAS